MTGLGVSSARTLGARAKAATAEKVPNFMMMMNLIER